MAMDSLSEFSWSLAITIDELVIDIPVQRVERFRIMLAKICEVTHIPISFIVLKIIVPVS